MINNDFLKHKHANIEVNSHSENGVTMTPKRRLLTLITIIIIIIIIIVTIIKKNHNSVSGDRNPGTYKERDEEIHPKDPGQDPHQRPTEDHTAWIVSHPQEDFIHQIGF